MLVRRWLHAAGFRFRLHDSRLPGSPDLVLRRRNAVIFVHGCFWHRHPGCRYATIPKTRAEFWQSKFDANLVRDGRNLHEVSDLGWRVAVIWECGLRPRHADVTLESLTEWLRGDSPRHESSVSELSRSAAD